MCALAVDASARLDGHELSSLCLAADGDLLAVSDLSFRIARGTPEPLRGTSRSRSLRKLVEKLSADPEKGSQWEGVATDGAGYIFVLQEHAGRKKPSHLFVFSESLDALAAVIALHVPKGEAEWSRAWRAEPNARAEAIVLLAQRHVLVVKQKDPIQLIEFGPPDDPPRGLSPETLAGPQRGERFLSDNRLELRYEPLRTWQLDCGTEPALESVNDAAVARGELFLVSRASRRIARLRIDSGSPGHVICVADSWALPQTIKNPEGLVMTGDLVPIVADDEPKQDRKRHNVFKLEPLAICDDR